LGPGGREAARTQLRRGVASQPRGRLTGIEVGGVGVRQQLAVLLAGALSLAEGVERAALPVASAVRVRLARVDLLELRPVADGAAVVLALELLPPLLPEVRRAGAVAGVDPPQQREHSHRLVEAAG